MNKDTWATNLFVQYMMQNALFVVFVQGILKFCDKISNPFSDEELSFPEYVYGALISCFTCCEHTISYIALCCALLITVDTYITNNCNAFKGGILSFSDLFPEPMAARSSRIIPTEEMTPEELSAMNDLSTNAHPSNPVDVDVMRGSSVDRARASAAAAMASRDYVQENVTGDDMDEHTSELFGDYEDAVRECVANSDRAPVAAKWSAKEVSEWLKDVLPRNQYLVIS